MYLEKLMDKILLENSVEFECVDVGFLIFFFKVFIGLFDISLIGRFKWIYILVCFRVNNIIYLFF